MFFKIKINCICSMTSNETLRVHFLLYVYFCTICEKIAFFFTVNFLANYTVFV